MMVVLIFPKQKGCTNMLKGYARAAQANMTEHGYERIFCSNMMKINQDIFRDSLKDTRIDIFMENSEETLSKLTHKDLKCERSAVASDSFAICPVLFCGLAGFSDFYKPDWLQWIIQRQDKDLGCFGREGECMAANLSSHPKPLEAAHIPLPLCTEMSLMFPQRTSRL